MTDTRTSIERAIATAPGVHFNELVRDTEYAPGQVQYHVRDLVDAGVLAREELFGRTHYYPPEYDAFERRVLALVRRETTRDVLLACLDDDPNRPAAVAERVGIARSTLEHHVGNLQTAGVLEKHRDSRGRVTLALARPQRTRDLLETVEPSVPARLVDRFTRLVDDLLAAE
ncbi:ArsR family transcriptional regulator [Halorubellus sp. JP-L1]|uniref:winged helix-turn-helix transcriptional regulator n=1 Tax=Halorubellus sp. JP-L1 TaxID=2715753 RepID=UPI001408805F|nr:ArsR family transcriptional regulator [Halorubellus sp. JP-L1]NHN43559.1 ArsR family transcriptional regulator [Halorubellus sp. JP-L1]